MTHAPTDNAEEVAQQKRSIDVYKKLSLIRNDEDFVSYELPIEQTNNNEQHQSSSYSSSSSTSTNEIKFGRIYDLSSATSASSTIIQKTSAAATSKLEIPVPLISNVIDYEDSMSTLYAKPSCYVRVQRMTVKEEDELIEYIINEEDRRWLFERGDSQDDQEDDLPLVEVLCPKSLNEGLNKQQILQQQQFIQQEKETIFTKYPKGDTPFNLTPYKLEEIITLFENASKVSFCLCNPILFHVLWSGWAEGYYEGCYMIPVDLPE